ncbi:hypothetical protein RYS15_18435, partial [Marinobacter xestospongiae]|nr:hypothetical protein [Marinobacter xestospongiae]
MTRQDEAQTQPQPRHSGSATIRSSKSGSNAQDYVVYHWERILGAIALLVVVVALVTWGIMHLIYPSPARPGKSESPPAPVAQAEPEPVAVAAPPETPKPADKMPVAAAAPPSEPDSEEAVTEEAVTEEAVTEEAVTEEAVTEEAVTE